MDAQLLQLGLWLIGGGIGIAVFCLWRLKHT